VIAKMISGKCRLLVGGTGLGSNKTKQNCHLQMYQTEKGPVAFGISGRKRLIVNIKRKKWEETI